MKDTRGNSGEHIEGLRYTKRPPTGAEIMQHFDMLPPRVRAAIAEAPCNFDPGPIAKALYGGFDPDRMATDLRYASIEFLVKAYLDQGHNALQARQLAGSASRALMGMRGRRL